MMDFNKNKVLKIAFLNIKGQSGLPLHKQKQIEDFVKYFQIDILNCQEINIDDETFNNCSFILSHFNIKCMCELILF